MLDRRIRKFEIGRRQVFNITYEKDNENTGGCDTLQLKCSEYPRPELIETVKRLSPYITKLLELPDDCKDRLIAKKTYLYIQRENGRDKRYHNGQILHTQCRNVY